MIERVRDPSVDARRNAVASASPRRLGISCERIQGMMAAITGAELVMTRLLGKWKGSRNQPTKNRTGVTAGSMEADRPEANAMVGLMAAGHDDRQAP